MSMPIPAYRLRLTPADFSMRVGRAEAEDGRITP